MPAPVANFTKVINYLTVAFTDASTNVPTSWLWDFGDGNTSVLQSPTHVYAGPGTYTIQLTATNVDGNSSTSQVITIGVPVASFRFTPNFLSVDFQDTSTNTPTAWSWDFGDGSPVSAIQNPTHVYATAGAYTVTLTSSNAGGASVYTRNILVSTTFILPLSLSDFIDARLPRGLVYDAEHKDALIVKWQLFLYTLVDPNIPSSSIYNELAWPPLVNALIASLVAYDILVNAAQQAFIQMLTSQTTGLNNGTSTGSTTTTGAGGVKKIVTGPSEVEWFDMADSFTNFFRNSSGSSASGGITSVGPLAVMQQDICTLASRLSIILGMCPALPKKVLPVSIIHKTRVSYNGVTRANWGFIGPGLRLVDYYNSGYFTI